MIDFMSITYILYHIYYIYANFTFVNTFLKNVLKNVDIIFYIWYIDIVRKVDVKYEKIIFKEGY